LQAKSKSFYRQGLLLVDGKVVIYIKTVKGWLRDKIKKLIGGVWGVAMMVGEAMGLMWRIEEGRTNQANQCVD
jgi:hypothetical protein